MMFEFLKGSIDYAYFLYGMGFFVFGATAFIISKTQKIPLPWKFLVAYCLLSGLQIWIGLFTFSLGSNTYTEYLRLVFFIAAFLFLIEFGRGILIQVHGIKLKRWFLTPFLIPLFISVLAPEQNWLNIAMHYSLGFFGLVFVSLVIFSLLKIQNRIIEPWFIISTGIIAFLYGLTYLVVPPANFYPASVLNYVVFEKFFGFPIQLIRGSLSILTAFIFLTYWVLLKAESWHPYQHNRKKKIKQITLVLLIFSFLILLGWALTYRIGKYYDDDARREFLKKTLILTTAFDPQSITTLNGESDDKNNPNYQKLKIQIESMHREIPECRYVYILGYRQGKVVFLVDSQAFTKEGYNPPGEIYEEASLELKRLFKGGSAFVEGPLKDKWGDWVSGIAPIRDLATGENIAVLGMDINATYWAKDILTHRVSGIVITMGLCVIFLSFFIILELNRNAAARILNSENRFRLMFEHAPEAIFIVEASSHKIAAANPFTEQWFGYSIKELLGTTLNELIDLDAAGVQGLIDKTVKDGALFIPEHEYRKKNGQKISMEVVAARVDFQGHTCVLVFGRDATERRLIEQEIRHLASFPRLNPNIILELDNKGQIKFYNDATTKVLNNLGLELKDMILFVPDNTKDLFSIESQRKTNTCELTISGHTFLETIIYVPELQTVRIYANDITSSVEAKKEKDRIFNLSLDMLCVVGFDGYLKQLNPAWAKTLGFTNEELLSKPYINFIHPEDRDRTEEVSRKLAEGESVFSFENRCLCRDGSYKWVSWNSFPLPQEKLVFAVVRDITTFKRSEDLLLRERNRAQMYFDIAGVIFIVLNSIGEVVAINRKGCRVLGYPEEDIIGRLWWENFIPETIRPTVEGVFLEVSKGNIELFEYFENPILTKNKEERLIAWHNTVIRDESDNITHVLSSGEDITERRRAEELLQEQLYFSQILIDNIPNPVFYKDTNGRYLGCNAVFEKYTGMSKKEITGKSENELFPKDLADIYHNKDIELLKNPGTQTYEGQIVYADGSRHDVIFYRATYLNRFGVLMGIVGVILDITELKKAYAELKETQSQLIQIEKMNVIGTLASGVAHEVKNPLAIIMQGVNFLEKDINPKEIKQIEVLNIIKEAIVRAEKIIHSLLDFSRRAPLEFKATTINKVIEASLSLVPKKFMPPDIKIIMDLNCEISKILVDENQLEQALLNTIVNALQAMPEGGNLNVRTYNKGFERLKDGIGRKAEDFFKKGDLAVIIEIEDTGKGIPENLLNKIFDPFFTTKPVGEGVGLGLSITRSIIDSHKGLINIASHEGKGTKVTITLPIAKN